jgi:hypothetical protein
VDSLALAPFNLHTSFHLFYLVFCSWINSQTFGTRLKWGWLNKTPMFDHFPVDSTSHLHILYCKRFVRLRVLFKTHIIYFDFPYSLKLWFFSEYLNPYLIMIWEIVHEYLFLSLCWMDITNPCLLDCYIYFCIPLWIQLIAIIIPHSFWN